MAQKKEKREISITVWLSEDEYEELNNYCYKFSLYRSQVIRCAIRKYIERN